MIVLNFNKGLLLCLCTLSFLFAAAQDNVGIGIANPNPRALLDLTSASKGLLVPRMTNAERIAINPAGTADAGLLVYDHDADLFYFWNAAQWVPFPQSDYNTTFTYDNNTRELAITDGGGTLSVTLPAASASNLCVNLVVNNIPVLANTGVLCNSILSQSGSNIGVNTTNPSVSLHINAQDGVAIPTGPSSARPGAAPTGTIRYNTDLGTTEVYTGACWQNTNTPPIGATYVQWVNAADPNGIYPCTQWVATDIANGEFIRAAGGASNVATGAPLTGAAQAGGIPDHQHMLNGAIDGAGALTTSTDGAHEHQWGGWWSNDDSRDWLNGNGDGLNGNTISDNTFWWGGNPATINYSQGDYSDVSNLVAASGAHNHGGSTGTLSSGANGIYIPFDDNVSNNTSNGGAFGGSNGTPCANPWNGNTTGGNFLGTMYDACLNHTHSITNDGSHTHSMRMYAHRHWLKQRPTSNDGAHAHTVPDHTHTHTLAVGSVLGATPEVRPVNQAVVFWRRVN